MRIANVYCLTLSQPPKPMTFTTHNRAWRISIFALLALANCRALGAVGDIHPLAEGSPVSFCQLVVTAVWADVFYAQKLDRSWAVGVTSSADVQPGDVVNVSGIPVKTSEELRITLATVTVVKHCKPPKPLQMKPYYVGAKDFGPISHSPRGLYNLDLLIEVYGEVAEVKDSQFLLKYGAYSCWVDARRIETPPIGRRVLVTGISGLC
ncbi:MAG: hypothetical protein WCL39_15310, partial [Armatimonadota bacterium]